MLKIVEYNCVWLFCKNSSARKHPIVVSTHEVLYKNHSPFHLLWGSYLGGLKDEIVTLRSL